MYLQAEWKTVGFSEASQLIWIYTVITQDISSSAC